MKSSSGVAIGCCSVVFLALMIMLISSFAYVEHDEYALSPYPSQSSIYTLFYMLCHVTCSRFKQRSVPHHEHGRYRGDSYQMQTDMFMDNKSLCPLLLHTPSPASTLKPHVVRSHLLCETSTAPPPTKWTLRECTRVVVTSGALIRRKCRSQSCINMMN